MDEQDIGMLIKQLYDAKEKRANQQLKTFGLTFSQFRILAYLREANGQAALKEIEAHFRLTQQTVAGVIKRLEEKEFVVTREAETDKRAKNVFLTEKGEQSCTDAIACYQKSQDLLTQGLAESEIQELRRLLLLVLENTKQ